MNAAASAKGCDARPAAPSSRPAGLAVRAAALAGLDPKAVGEANLLAALDKAAARLGLDGPEACLVRLAGDARERRRLAGEAVVQESWLFREPETFAALKSLAGSLPIPVRALCVPCARGEEAVSMALTFLDAGLPPEDFHVDAADVCEDAINAARSGVFGNGSVRSDLGAARSHFTPSRGGLAVGADVAASIRYLEADVLDEEFLTHEPPYQVIFCRHLLIYLAPAGRKRLVAALRRLLGRDGLLFTTPAEAAAFMGLGLKRAARASGAPVLTAAPHKPAGSATTASEASARATRAGSCHPPDHTRGPQPGFDPLIAPREGPSAFSQPPPASPPAAPELLEQARSLAGTGRLREALETIDRALSQGGPMPGLFALMGAALLALGRPEAAEEAFRRCLYLDPCHVEALSHLELMARAAGRGEEASRLSARLKRAGEPRRLA